MKTFDHTAQHEGDTARFSVYLTLEENDCQSALMIDYDAHNATRAVIKAMEDQHMIPTSSQMIRAWVAGEKPCNGKRLVY